MTKKINVLSFSSDLHFGGDENRILALARSIDSSPRDIGDRRGEGNALGNLGVAYKNLGDTHRAIQFYEQYLAITREIGDRRGEGIALLNISLTLDRLGKSAQAILHAEQALTILEQIEDPNAPKVRAQLAAWREQTNT